MEAIDLIINPRWIIPVRPTGAVFENCAIAIREGAILGIFPAEEASRKFKPGQQVNLPDHVILPGLINSHGHAAMTLFRGLADDCPLHEWLNDHIWPAEARWVSADFVRDGAELAVAEMIRAGTTCFSDMYFFPDQVVDVAIKAGIRAQVAFPVLKFPTAWARDAEEYLHKGLQLRDDYKGSDTIRIAFGPHAVYTVDQASLEKIAMLAEELDSCIQIHLHETAAEVTDFHKTNGSRPLEYLAQLQLLSPLTQCVHMTQLTGSDLQLLQKHNPSVIHCPHSNLKLASGLLPLAELRERETNVALGTDGAASNNGLDLFSELRAAAMLAKAISGKAESLSAFQALEMATINGARALGIEEVTGSLEKGKSADLVAVNLGEIESQPVYNPMSQLVYNSSAGKVSHVWCRGKALLAEGELLTLHAQEILAKTRQWREKIQPGVNF